MPLPLPPPKVCLTTMARLGPGDMAPKQQMATKLSQTVKLISLPIPLLFVPADAVNDSTNATLMYYKPVI
ncbi:protein of unknown function [Shewanella benthica]|uniref:Uncharacterized protein n=1 Tax=Shewanella benthica TaxID=43661 RepID=A0A330M084_9GAMM|nr:protein of unknown function [Shewanella benthica]